MDSTKDTNSLLYVTPSYSRDYVTCTAAIFVSLAPIDAFGKEVNKS